MTRCLLAACVCFWLSAALIAQTPEVKPVELTADEKELIALTEAMQKAYVAFYAESEKIKDEKAWGKFYLEKDPALEFLPKFEALEKKHHGTHLGLMVARRLTVMAASSVAPDSPGNLARRKMLDTLDDYAGFELLPEVLNYVDVGNLEPAIEPCLRSIIASPKATEQNRLFAKLILARWSLQMCMVRENTDRREKELTPSEKEDWAKKVPDLALRLKSVLPRERTEQLKPEAIETLRMLSQADASFKRPSIKGIDNGGLILQVDADPNKLSPTIKDLAAGLLFKEEHLSAGKPAPELHLELTTGEPWSLADQKGKCVIIQFSFKGCGPCEEMYPDLTELAKQFPEKLSIVSIMADQTREDTLEAVDSGKITWGAHFDGHRGPICTKWDVRGFPTVYVINREGKVAVENSMRGDQLKAKVAELCK